MNRINGELGLVELDEVAAVLADGGDSMDRINGCGVRALQLNPR